MVQQQVESAEKIKVLLADGHMLFRQGLLPVLSNEGDIEVVRETDDSEKVTSLVEVLLPDVVILDSELSSPNSLSLAREIRLQAPNVAVILLVAHDDEEQLFQAIKVGAAACFTRKVHSDDLVSAIRRCSQGEYLINESLLTVPGVASRVLKEFQALSLLLRKEVEPLVAPLSPREIEILDYIACGNSNKQIANVFGITEQTVKNHMTSILRRLAAHDRTHAVVIALEQGWIRTAQKNRPAKLQRRTSKATRSRQGPGTASS